MGLIKAAVGAIGGTLADQWKDYFYCEALPPNILAVKGKKRVGERSSNTSGSDNIITSGSIAAVADGQCMLIVEQGKILDVCNEPGEYTFDTAGEPSLFTGGDFGDNVVASMQTAWERFKFGGQPGKDTRIYYINTKELVGNRYGTPAPVPFRVVDTNIGLDVDISIRCHGEFSYKIINPILFYTNVCGNFSDFFLREIIEDQLVTELMTALQPAFAKISAMGIRYSMLPGHTIELAAALNEVLSPKWRELRGLEIVSLGVSSVNASREDEDMIKNLQKSAVMRNPGMAAAAIIGAQAEAMKAAASNESTGPMLAFAGMNMAANAGGMNAQNLFHMQQQAIQQPTTWTCSCGNVGNTGKFCSECAAPNPYMQTEWTCVCGTVNKGKFCSECAAPRQ